MGRPRKVEFSEAHQANILAWCHNNGILAPFQQAVRLFKHHAKFRKGDPMDVKESIGWQKAVDRWHIPRQAKTNPNYQPPEEPMELVDAARWAHDRATDEHNFGFRWDCPNAACWEQLQFARKDFPGFMRFWKDTLLATPEDEAAEEDDEKLDITRHDAELIADIRRMIKERTSGATS